MKKVMACMLCLFLMSTTVADAYPRASVREVVVDGFYGAVAGALIGTATLAFVDKASERTENIGRGAAIGVILGSAYGSLKLFGAVDQSFVPGSKIMVESPALQHNLSLGSGEASWPWRLTSFPGPIRSLIQTN